MNWMKAAVTDMEEIREASGGVAMIPVGSLEIHGPHLPLGSDPLVAERIAEMIADIEPVAVLPVIPYTYVPGAGFHPGAICIRAEILLAFLENVCDEIARNGFKKIILLHAHGGNVPMHNLFPVHTLERGKDYAVYSIPPWAGTSEKIKEVQETKEVGHACELETSLLLYFYPELCKMGRLDDTVYTRQKDLDVGPISTPVDWPAYYPDACIGEPKKASKEKGEVLAKTWVDSVVEIVRKVKKDKVVPGKMAEFRRILGKE